MRPAEVEVGVGVEVLFATVGPAEIARRLVGAGEVNESDPTASIESALRARGARAVGSAGDAAVGDIGNEAGRQGERQDRHHPLHGRRPLSDRLTPDDAAPTSNRNRRSSRPPTIASTAPTTATAPPTAQSAAAAV